MHPWFGIILLWFSVIGEARSQASNQRETIFDDIDILSHKEVPASICGNASSYAGYVNFPPNIMKEVSHDYPIHTFFWYFKSQNDPQNSPLIIWLNGGPGASSMFGLFAENGPCRINSQLAPELNNMSWNQDYNILYVDQPVQSGFSYDVITNGLLDLETGNIIPTDSNETAQGNRTFINGTFSSQNVNSTANTTEIAARHFWNFLQVWTQKFPEYNSSDSAISIWTESYGGRYGPSFGAYIQEQNSRIRNGSLPDAKVLNFTTLGIINGCVDLLVQETSAPEFAYNMNPYNIPGITRDEYSGALEAYTETNGCHDKILRCLGDAKAGDPNMYGNITEVNELCEDASDFCQNQVEGPYLNRKKWGFYDIAHCYLDAFPGNEYLYYLADEDVRKSLGVPVNYTDISNAVGKAFNLTGDYARRNPQGYLENIGTLLDSGVQVAMVYGDRDFACNWIGGERVSRKVSYAQSDNFKLAGYANVTLNGSTTASTVGQVRQHGLFSFTRVFQSGHMVPAYQPEVSLHILNRAMRQKDIATGDITVTGNYSTSGPSNSTVTLKAPPVPSVTCYLRGLASTCADNQIEAVKNGTAVMKNGVIVSPTPPPQTCPDLPSIFHDEMKGDAKDESMFVLGAQGEL
ncbi:carboxypeptidase S1 [Annulohypoxylon bovei var. microspora]|nr:carboxypeptidase S1 [Annulohypoxylon bovei var. microspora]